MKQFLYIDNDIVDSIVAQAEKGLAKNITVEEGSERSVENNKEKLVEGTLGGSGNILGILKSAGELGARFTAETGEHNATAFKGIVAKVMHDAAFDIAMMSISPIDISVDNLGCGEHFIAKRNYSFVDLDYLSSLFNDKELIDYLKQSYHDEAKTIIQKIKEGTNRQQRRESKFDEKEELSKLIETNNKQYDDARQMLNLFNTVVPYKRMLISDDGLLFPLEDKYFRVSPTNLGFRYGGEITCVGMVTNVIEKQNIDDGNLFRAIQTSINDALKGILPTKADRVLVAHPIAVYYEIE